MPRILLGVTGSVAAVKLFDLDAALRFAGHEVRIVATEAACYFFDPLQLINAADRFFRDGDEWPGEIYHRGEPVLHIELRRWAEILLIAPLDANTLAKLAFGLADNCLTCVARAWEPSRLVVVAPAMNTLMWQQPLTSRHLQQLALNHDIHLTFQRDPLKMCDAINAMAGTLRIVPPQEKELACGDIGIGAMATIESIVKSVAHNNSLE